MSSNNLFQTPELFVTAAQAYPMMEKLILRASQRLDLSFHIFSPATKCRHPSALAQGFKTWSDLLCDALKRGVTINLLINDFDPVGMKEAHFQAWHRLAILLKSVEVLPLDQQKRLHVQLAHPGGQGGLGLRLLLWPFIRQEIKRLFGNTPTKKHLFVPGLMALMTSHESVKWWPPKRLFTQTLHQKFMIQDQKYAIIGGLDVDERRFDDPEHQRKAPETWHDVSIGISGESVGALSAFFGQCWNNIYHDGSSYTQAFYTHSFFNGKETGSHLNLNTARLCLTSHPMPTTTPPLSSHSNRLKIVTTQARPSLYNPFTFGPKTTVADIEAAHLEMIDQARSLIYIETQFLRSRTIAKSLISAARRCSDLHLIVLLPAAPQVIAFEGNTSSIHRYGEWLQARNLEQLCKAYERRIGIFCLTNEINRTEKIERDALYKKSMVYIHSKVMFVDDQVGLISSANLNGRSMRWDYEVGVVIREAEIIRGFRQELWKIHLPDYHEASSRLKAADALKSWQDRAQKRSQEKENAMGCGIVPFPMTKTKRFSKSYFYFPENLV